MTLEAVLASMHLLAIFTLVVFLSSEASLCRAEWMNAAVLERLGRLDLLYGLSALAVLLTGGARIVWGAKGWIWYVGQPLFHVKALLFVLVALMSILPTLTIRRWLRAFRATGEMPSDDAVQRMRHWILIQAHGIPVILVIAVFWARGM